MQEGVKNEINKQKATLFEIAKNWLNIPFRVHGHSKKGCDCVGLVVSVLLDAKIIDDDFFNKFISIKYGKNLQKVDRDKMMEMILSVFDETNDFNDCDLLLARGKNSPIHFMIVEKTADKNKKIIHTTRENGFSCCVNFDYNLMHFIDKMFVLKKSYENFRHRSGIK